MTARQVVAAAMSEAELQTNILDMCRVYGLLVHHCRPARTKDGRWSTPIQGNPGFPDLVISGPGGVLFRELKAAGRKPTPDQLLWLDTLQTAGVDASVWFTADWFSGQIRAELEAIRR